MSKYLVLFCVFLLSSLSLRAQDTLSSRLEQLSLEELLNIKVTVASGDEQAQKDAPGMVTVIYSDEIRYGGARDLIDVLRAVPGLFFAQDVENIISLGIRGLWAQEGKVLLLRDGVELHETSYNTLQFLQHYPLHQLDRIEIIRGPGSVIYGGNAGLCVINLISIKDKSNDGLSAGGLYSRLERADGQKSGWFSMGKNFSDGFGFRLSGNFLSGIFSDRVKEMHLDSLTLQKVDFSDSSAVSNAALNASFWYKDLELRYLFDDHRHDVSLGGFRYQHLTHAISIRNKFRIGEKLLIVPQLMQKQMYPWRYLNASDSLRMGNFFNKRTEANLQARFTFSEHWNLLSGARFMEDYSQYYEPSSPFVFSLSGKNDIRFTTISVFLQSENRYRNFLLTSGLRYEKHSQFGAVLVPRLNLTGSLSEWSFDLQYNEAFRAPSIINMDLNPSIKPERTIDYEAELNRMLGKKTRFSLVLYHMQVMNPIVYTFQNGSENYFNDVKLGTAGLETEFHYRDQHTEIRASYSFYYSVFSSPLFAVEDRSMSNIAMPNHKVNIMARRFFGKHFYLSAQALTFSSVFGYDFTDDLIEQRPMALVSVSSGFRNIANHWDVSVSVNDLLNEQFNYFQAYRSGNDPLPGAGRAWHLKLIYRLPFGQGR